MLKEQHSDFGEKERQFGPPCVSVLLPVFDAEATITAALDSILAQRGVELEVVAVDDGSNDDSPCLLVEAAERDCRVRPILLPHRGLVAALQAGLAASRGEYVARMDADDIALPHRLEKQVDFLKQYPAVVAIGGGARYLIDGRPSDHVVQPPLGGDPIERLLEREPPIIHPTAVIRRDALLRVGGYRSAFRHAEDYDLWLRLAEIGKLANIPDIVLEYRVSGEQVTMQHLEASLLAKLGARVCAQYRHDGHPDPAPIEGCIDRGWLLDHGQCVDRIDGLILETYVDRIWWLVGMGMLEAAEQLVDDLGRLRVAPSLESERLFSWRWERARVAWFSKRPGRAMVSWAAACVGSPGLWLRRVAGWAGRRLRPQSLAPGSLGRNTTGFMAVL